MRARTDAEILLPIHKASSVTGKLPITTYAVVNQQTYNVTKYWTGTYTGAVKDWSEDIEEAKIFGRKYKAQKSRSVGEEIIEITIDKL